MKKYVILEHLCLPDRGFRFFTTNSESDPTRIMSGEIAYKVVGYSDTIEGSQSMIRHNFQSASSNELELYYRLKEPTCYSIEGHPYDEDGISVEYAKK